MVVFHRDMKMENLLLLNEIIKIADFGFVEKLEVFHPILNMLVEVSSRMYSL